MKLFTTILLAVLATGSIAAAKAPAKAKAADCIAQSEMQVIAGNFPQFASLANADFCNDDSQNWHLLSSIMFMRKTQFDAEMPLSKDELFSGRFAKNWYDYFTGRINELEIVQDCPKGVIAYVYGFGGNTMYVCPMALTNTFSSLDRASVMMHEARHIDGFPHMTCTHGARKGISGACDNKIATGGSYAVTVETYAQLAKYAQGVHPAMKAYARSSAIVYADEAFETQVKIGRAENLLALTDALDFHRLNLQTKEVTRLGQAFAAGKIIRRGQHMILIPTDKTQKAQYVFANNEGTIAQSPSDMITEYNAGTPDQKANLVDIHIGAQWSARVYKNSVRFVCDPTSPATKDLALPAGQTAASLVYPDGYARDRYTALLTTQSGDVLELGCVNRQASIKASAVRFDQPYARIYKAGSEVFGLTNSGSLFKIEAGRSTAVNTALDGRIIEIVPQESFDFFQ